VNPPLVEVEGLTECRVPPSSRTISSSSRNLINILPHGGCQVNRLGWEFMNGNGENRP